jgi:hypothetical protein
MSGRGKKFDAAEKHFEKKRIKEELKEWIECLLEYTELSKDDIKAVCEKDKRMGEAINWLSRFGGMFQGYI